MTDNSNEGGFLFIMNLKKCNYCQQHVLVPTLTCETTIY